MSSVKRTIRFHCLSENQKLEIRKILEKFGAVHGPNEVGPYTNFFLYIDKDTEFEKIYDGIKGDLVLAFKILGYQVY